MTQSKNIVSDVSGLYLTTVFSEIEPLTTNEVVAALARVSGDVSVGGGRFSMGGQIASPGSLHIDMRRMNRVLEINQTHQTITVQAGITWHDIQRQIDRFDLSIGIMQTYGNFTVGGSLSVNAHGRYIGQGPLVLSVIGIVLVKANGEIIKASPTENKEVFYGSIGGYGGLGVITEVTLQLAKNMKVESESEVMPVNEYLEFFRSSVQHNKKVIFHNANIYPPLFDKIRSVTWSESEKSLTNKNRLHSPEKSYPLERAMMWMVSELPFGKSFREHILEPIFYKFPKVHLRNYEASYDVAELEPYSRKNKTYVLQEYFVPIDKMLSFVQKCAEVLNRHDVNSVNISIRHSKEDPGTLLAWAKSEVFAFVLYYKQGTSVIDQCKVAVWTRELVQAAIEHGGSYYLPYQSQASQEQFEAAYPRYTEMFALKNQMDPEFRFKNVIWNTYYSHPTHNHRTKKPELNSLSDFGFVMSSKSLSDKLFLFLQVVFKTYSPERLHELIKSYSSQDLSDDEIYQKVQAELPNVKVFMNDLRFGLPALINQKNEMNRQTLELLGSQKSFKNYMEIGSKSRYCKYLQKSRLIEGELHFVEERPATFSPIDILERGSLKKFGIEHRLGIYEPLTGIKKGSISLALCYIGLHHADPNKIDAFIASISESMAEGGTFILREHDIKTTDMNRFVSLIHTVFNMGLNESLDYNTNELRHFNTLTYWIDLLERHGFKKKSGPLFQKNDPSMNALISFEKMQLR